VFVNQCRYKASVIVRVRLDRMIRISLKKLDLLINLPLNADIRIREFSLFNPGLLAKLMISDYITSRGGSSYFHYL